MIERIDAYLKQYKLMKGEAPEIHTIYAGKEKLELTVDDLGGLLAVAKRAQTLLQATRDMLQQAELGPYVRDPLEILTEYDGTQCDGNCLRDDIDNWFFELGKEPVVITEMVEYPDA